MKKDQPNWGKLVATQYNPDLKSDYARSTPTPFTLLSIVGRLSHKSILLFMYCTPNGLWMSYRSLVMLFRQFFHLFGEYRPPGGRTASIWNLPVVCVLLSVGCFCYRRVVFWLLRRLPQPSSCLPLPPSNRPYRSLACHRWHTYSCLAY